MGNGQQFYRSDGKGSTVSEVIAMASDNPRRFQRPGEDVFANRLNDYLRPLTTKQRVAEAEKYFFAIDPSQAGDPHYVDDAEIARRLQEYEQTGVQLESRNGEYGALVPTNTVLGPAVSSAGIHQAEVAPIQFGPMRPVDIGGGSAAADSTLRETAPKPQNTSSKPYMPPKAAGATGGGGGGGGASPKGRRQSSSTNGLNAARHVGLSDSEIASLAGAYAGRTRKGLTAEAYVRSFVCKKGATKEDCKKRISDGLAKLFS
jgi:hypothetical protein